MPLTGTPAGLIPQMLEAEYTREVIDKLQELRVAILDVVERMHCQSELVIGKMIEC